MQDAFQSWPAHHFFGACLLHFSDWCCFGDNKHRGNRSSFHWRARDRSPFGNNSRRNSSDDGVLNDIFSSLGGVVGDGHSSNSSLCCAYSKYDLVDTSSHDNSGDDNFDLRQRLLKIGRPGRQYRRQPSPNQRLLKRPTTRPTSRKTLISWKLRARQTQPRRFPALPAPSASADSATEVPGKETQPKCSLLSPCPSQFLKVLRDPRCAMNVDKSRS